MAPNSNANTGSVTLATASPRSLAQRCALCDGLRSQGSLLNSRHETGNSMLWVCSNCQHKLARRVDDEGALGG